MIVRAAASIVLASAITWVAQRLGVAAALVAYAVFEIALP